MLELTSNPAQFAYDEAVRLIEEAIVTGSTRLRLDQQNTRFLEVLPNEILGLPDLQILNLNNTKIADISLLSQLPALEWLWLENTKVFDLTPLQNLPSLMLLGLSGTLVEDLRPLASLRKLQDLDLDGIPCDDLRPLRDLTNLIYSPEFDGLTFRNCGAARKDAIVSSPPSKGLDIKSLVPQTPSQNTLLHM